MKDTRAFDMVASANNEKCHMDMNTLWRSLFKKEKCQIEIDITRTQSPGNGKEHRIKKMDSGTPSSNALGNGSHLGISFSFTHH